jgi:DNA-binding response OmpR family regulator
MSEAAVISRGAINGNPAPAGSVLIVDDEAEIRESLQTLLEMEGFEVEASITGEEGLAQMAERPFDLVLLDLTLPGRNGMEILSEIRGHDPRLPVIMITAYGTVENAVRAMQSGAANFVQKPWDNEKLLADVRAAVGWRRAEEENVQLKRALKQRYNFENIVGKSEPMLKIFDLVAQVANSRSTVLLQGESGTGKEVIAKAIHLNSPRRDKPFVPVNTGSMPTDLLESTLFGHVKGAFTSAVASTKEPCSSTKSRPWGWRRRPRSSASCRIAASCTWAGFRKSRWTCASSPPPTSICGRWCARGASGKIFFTGLMSLRSSCRPCASERKTFRCWWSFS